MNLIKLYFNRVKNEGGILETPSCFFLQQILLDYKKRYQLSNVQYHKHDLLDSIKSQAYSLINPLIKNKKSNFIIRIFASRENFRSEIKSHASSIKVVKARFIIDN